MTAPQAALLQLVQALRDEAQLLTAGDTERLAALIERKEILLNRLAAAPRADWPRELVEQAKALNDRNALLLAPRLAAVRARADFLRQASGDTLYGARGELR